MLNRRYLLGHTIQHKIRRIISLWEKLIASLPSTQFDPNSYDNTLYKQPDASLELMVTYYCNCNNGWKQIVCYNWETPLHFKPILCCHKVDWKRSFRLFLTFNSLATILSWELRLNIYFQAFTSLSINISFGLSVNIKTITH